MFSYYKTQGMSLLEKLDMLYREFGYSYNTLHSFEFEGESGFHHMQAIMEKFRTGLATIAGKTVTATLDYKTGINGLPRSNVIKFLLEDGCSVVVRPSGTEPKLKLYLSVLSPDRMTATDTEQTLIDYLKAYMA